MRVSIKCDRLNSTEHIPAFPSYTQEQTKSKEIKKNDDSQDVVIGKTRKLTREIILHWGF